MTSETEQRRWSYVAVEIAFATVLGIAMSAVGCSLSLVVSGLITQLGASKILVGGTYKFLPAVSAVVVFVLAAFVSHATARIATARTPGPGLRGEFGLKATWGVLLGIVLPVAMVGAALWVLMTSTDVVALVLEPARLLSTVNYIAPYVVPLCGVAAGALLAGLRSARLRRHSPERGDTPHRL